MQFYIAHNGVDHATSSSALSHQLGIFLLVAVITAAFAFTLITVLTSLSKKDAPKDKKK